MNLILSRSVNCVIVCTAVANQGATFSITDTKLCVPIVILSAQDNAKLLEKLKLGFKKTINWDKYQSKAKIQARNRYLDYLIDPSFQVVNRPILLLFENNAHQTSYNQYCLATAEIEDYDVKIDGNNVMIDKNILISQ